MRLREGKPMAIGPRNPTLGPWNHLKCLNTFWNKFPFFRSFFLHPGILTSCPTSVQRVSNQCQTSVKPVSNVWSIGLIRNLGVSWFATRLPSVCHSFAIRWTTIIHSLDHFTLNLRKIFVNPRWIASNWAIGCQFVCHPFATRLPLVCHSFATRLPLVCHTLDTRWTLIRKDYCRAVSLACVSFCLCRHFLFWSAWLSDTGCLSRQLCGM